jgi:hypothetical protein
MNGVDVLRSALFDVTQEAQEGSEAKTSWLARACACLCCLICAGVTCGVGIRFVFRAIEA